MGGALTCETNNEKIATCSITGTKVTVKSAKESGTVNITVKSSANGDYKEGTAVYTAIIEDGTNPYKSSGYNKKYDGKEHGITVTSEGSIIKYGTEEGTYDKDKSPTRKDVGTTTVYYQIIKSGYKAIYGKEDIVISKASGKATLASTTIDIGTNETKKIEVSDATGKISCESENNSIAVCSVTNKTITIKGVKKGTTKLNIKVASSNNYKEVTKTINTNVILKCKFDGNLTQGTEYTNGQYTYRYKQGGKYSKSGLAWANISEDGWGVQLTNKSSQNAVTSNLCTYINDKPIVSMEAMFAGSAATKVDLSSFNTSKVTNMYAMFYNSAATTLNLSSFNTSNVTNMYAMFAGSAATTLNLSSFNTSNVTDMSYMFWKSKATTLDLSSFNTSNVTNMSYMLSNSAATKINGLEKFNTNKVTDMSYMFADSTATTLDLSSFNTSNVTNMYAMFYGSAATTGYARNNEEAAKFNDLSFKPSTLIFTVK